MRSDRRVCCFHKRVKAVAIGEKNGLYPLGAAARAGTGLTARELEVAVLLARGFRNRKIAAALVITEKTAANHVQRVLDKLGVTSRAQVAARAAELDIEAPTGEQVRPAGAPR